MPVAITANQNAVASTAAKIAPVASAVLLNPVQSRSAATSVTPPASVSSPRISQRTRWYFEGPSAVAGVAGTKDSVGSAASGVARSSLEIGAGADGAPVAASSAVLGAWVS